MINFDEYTVKDWEQNQGETIDYILEILPPLDLAYKGDEYQRVVTGGICYMLSMEWLRLIVTGEARSIWGDDFGMLEDVKKQPAYYKQIMNNFYAYASEMKVTVKVNGKMKEMTILEALTGTNNYADIAIDKELVSLCMKQAAQVTGEAIFTSEDEMADNMDRGRLMFIGLDFLIKENLEENIVEHPEGHQVAAYRESETVMYFFDPNIGTIKAEGTTPDELKVKVRKLVNDIWHYYQDENTQGGVIRYLN